MNKKFSRRNFLKTTTASSLLLSTTNPLGVLFHQIMDSTAHAQTAQAKRFISFVILGAPPRWMFDLILDVGDIPPDVNAMTSTSFHSETGVPIYKTTSSTYQTSDGINFNPPAIWDSALGDGDSNFMPQLLTKMMSIRAVRTIGNHPPAKLSTHVHSFSKAGVHTLAQEQGNNNAPASCVQYGVNFPFNARNEISNLTVKYDDSEGFNPIEEILRPFLKEHTPDKDFSSSLGDIFDEAFNAFFKGDKIKTFSDGAKDSIKSSQQNAKLLFIGATKDLINSYPNILTKYKSAITNQMNNNGHLPEVPLPENNSSLNKKYHFRPDTSYTMDNSGNFKTLNDVYSGENTNLDQMASSFAVAEILSQSNGSGVLSQGITNSMVFYLGQLKIYSAHAHTNGVFSNQPHYNDAHNIGSYPTTFGFTKYYQCFSQCLKLLITSFGGMNSEKFRNTLIQLSGDFNRTPRDDEAGSDHASEGVFTYFGGAINGPLLGGACKVNTKSNWQDYGQSYFDETMDKNETHTVPKLSSIHCFEGVAKFLGVPKLTNSVEPCFTFSNGAFSIHPKFIAKNYDVSTDEEES